MKYPIRSLIEVVGWLKKNCARKTCNRDFWVIPSKSELIYCCKECRHQPWETRLWANVVKGTTPEACWTFKLVPNAEGYPYLKKNGKEERVARLMWEIHNGPIPEGLVVRHTCDRPPCVNPAHLIIGTKQDDANDRVERDRGAKGETHGNADLTVEQVIAVKKLKGTMTLAQAQQQTGIPWKNVHNIWSGATWKHVDVPPTT